MALMDRPVQARQDELDALRNLAQLLKQQGMKDPAEASEVLVLTGGAGDPVIVPDSLRTVLAGAVHVMLRGDAVSVATYHAEMTTQEAADYLAVSRPYLISLLDAGEIPYTRLRSHRRLRLTDIEAYRARTQAERMKALDELTREIYEAGLYTMEGLEKPDE